MLGKQITTYSDEKLMQLICGGNQYAFNVLYHRHKNRMYYYFYRMLNNSEEQANDFLQELFLKIIEKPEAFNPEYKFRSWIFSIAGNMCKNEYRRREIHGEIITGNFTNDETEELNFSTYSTEQAVEKVFETLNRLDQDHRSTFLLRYREGFSIKEIAGILEIADGTVKSRLHNAKKQLARKLDYLKDEIDMK